MDKQIVRESKYRNIFGKTWRTELSYTNFSIHPAPFISANTRFFAYPVEGHGGGIAIHPMEERGKLQVKAPFIECHNAPLASFDWYPFEDCIFATSGREGTIKVWTLPNLALERGGSDFAKLLKEVKIPLTTLNAHSKKLNGFEWNPVASNVAVSTAADKLIKIWDIQNEKNASTFESAKEVMSVTWNYDGRLVCAASDVAAIYDVRAPQKEALIQQGVTHTSVKPFRAYFTKEERLVTVGFAKGVSDRQVGLFDARNLSQPLTMQTIDHSSATLAPFFDEGTGIAFLGGKGDLIFCYEVNNEPPYLHYLNKYNAGKSYLALTMLPKRCVDVKTCEIARFMKVNDPHTVETVSFIVPRKTQDKYFQEDIFPPAPSGQAALKGVEWFSGKNAKPATRSLKPIGAISVFDVSEDEGGKSRVKEEQKKATGGASKNFTKVNEGWAQIESAGWFRNTVEKRWLVINPNNWHLFVFETNESANSLFKIPLKNIAELLRPTPNTMELKVDDGQVHKFQFDSDKSRDNWIFSIEEEKEKATNRDREFQEELEAGKKLMEEAGIEFDEDQEEPGKLKGNLWMLYPGKMFELWKEHYFILSDAILEYYETRNSPAPIENIHLSKIIAVDLTELEGSKEGTFRITTKNKVIHLATDDEAERDSWVACLECKRLCYSIAENKEVAPPNEQLKHEGWLDKQQGTFGGWKVFFVTVAETDMLFLQNQASLTPDFKLSIALVSAVESVEEEEAWFRLVMNDGSTHTFRTSSVDSCQEWIEVLSAIRIQTVNVLDSLGISEEDADQKAPEPEQIANWIDPVDVKNGKRPLLIQVKGKRKIRVSLAELSWKSLHQSTTFILDNGKLIYHWNGRKAMRVAKAKGLDVSSAIRMKERGGNSKIVTLEDGKEDDDPEFWKLLGGKGAIPEGEIVESNEVERLYRISAKDMTGPRMKIVFEGPLPPKELLDTRYVYVVDCDVEIYIWVGKQSNAYQRNLGSLVAMKLQKGPKKPAWTSICRINENSETIIFKEKFLNFPGMLPISMTAREMKSNVAGKVAQDKIDVARLFTLSPPEQTMPDSCEGSIQMWKIEEFDKIVIPAAEHGIFYSGESFLFAYTYKLNNKEYNIVYFWQGFHSSRSEKGTSAYLTVDLSDTLDNVEQMRVIHNAEERHFLSLFSNRFVVRKGKYTEFKADKTTLYEVRGDEPHQVRASETDKFGAEMLDSFYSYILVEPKKNRIFLWHGTHAHPCEREGATQIVANRFTGGSSFEIVELEEGKEVDDLWKVLGSKPQKIFHSHLPLGSKRPAKLFLVSNASGAITMEPVWNFTQEDLIPGHPFILDTGLDIFVWFSFGEATSEKKLAMESALEYLQLSKTHSKETKVWVTYQFREPREFTAYFRGWSDAKFPPEKSQKGLAKIPVNDILRDYQKEVYTLDELLQEPLPVGVDPAKLEKYLTPEDFEAVFNMSPAEFQKLPSWKQSKVKSSVGLY